MKVSTRTQSYFKRFTTYVLPEVPPLRKETCVTVVLPCYNETDVIGALQSLREADKPNSPVDVLVFINASAEDSEEVHRQNERSFKAVKALEEETKNDRLRFLASMNNALNPAKAGVGLARKTLMDTAALRFGQIEQNGLMVNLDADCRVAPNFLRCLERVANNPEIDLCLQHFEHPFEQLSPSDPLRTGIMQYELHLRYYVQALRFAGYPKAQHTVGSCIAVKTVPYCKEGGFNTRQAGEDYYFVSKMNRHYGVLYNAETTVYPSCRLSDRVPFGTGRAMLKYAEKPEISSYSPRVFLAIKPFFDGLKDIYEGRIMYEELLEPAALEALNARGFAKALPSIRKQSTSFESFCKRLFFRLDYLAMLKWVHALCETYPKDDICKVSQELLVLKGLANPPGQAEELLYAFRDLDKNLTQG